eukprot:13217598-Alexandrium_andersonii.AAC.1
MPTPLLRSCSTNETMGEPRRATRRLSWKASTSPRGRLTGLGAFGPGRASPSPFPRAGPWPCGGRANGLGSRRTEPPGSLWPTPSEQ